MKQVFALISLVTVLTGCYDPRTEEVNELKEACIQVHDEVMPRMGEVANLRKSLREWHKTLDVDSADSLLALKQSVALQVQILDSADEAMMDWMANYDPMYATVHSLDSAIAYYAGLKERIIEVKTLTEESIKDATELLEKRD